jgi:hypothetical protein
MTVEQPINVVITRLRGVLVRYESDKASRYL